MFERKRSAAFDRAKHHILTEALFGEARENCKGPISVVSILV